jgi:hypothetical protein
MSLGDKLKPEENLWFTFKEGLLHVLGEKEVEIHNQDCRLYYGNSKEFAHIEENFQYNLPLADLKKIKEYIFLWKFKYINQFTQAKRTLRFGLKIRRVKNDISKYFSDTATFSRKEFKIIKRYL